MRRVLGCSILLFLLVLTVATPQAKANGISYLVTGTYGPTTPITPVSAPNASFSFAFGVPLPLTLVSYNANSFTISEPVMFSSGALNLTQTANVIFYDTSGGGLFDIEFPVGGTNYAWVLFGQQLFTGTTSNPTLLLGNFAMDPVQSFFWVPGSMSTYAVSGNVAATPEPGSLILLGSGLLGLAAWTRKIRR